MKSKTNTNQFRTLPLSYVDIINDYSLFSYIFPGVYKT